MMRVLLAHDGSDGAAKAVALARSIAWPKGSILRVVSVIEPIVMPLPGPWADGTASSTLAAESLLAGWPIFDGIPIRVVSVAHIEHPWATGIAPTMYRRVLEAYAADLRDARQTHRRLAAEAAARLREAGRLTEPELREGDPATEIIAVAEERGADLIVLGSRGHTGLTRILLGSVARNVLHGSSASVLIVRERTVEPAA